jgi:pyridoxamine 5'-phosphate oxidase
MKRLREHHVVTEVSQAVDLLSEAAADPDPMRKFEAWYADAVAADLPQPDAMALATVSPEGRPSARMVLLKQADQRGFVFFTNYDSRKGRELATNPYAALVFYWNALHRQVRIEGRVERLAATESDEYFATRPRGSQVAAVASRQSEPIDSRAVLENRVQELEKNYGAGEVPRPDYWGGYRVVPSVIEFWQGRPNRLHDRLRYDRVPDGSWSKVRLSP